MSVQTRACVRVCVQVQVQVCGPTALFIAVVPAIVVPVAVPQAANTVAVLAVKLVLLTLSGSCRERKKRGRGDSENATTAEERH